MTLGTHSHLWGRGPYLERGFTGRLDAQSSREAGGGTYLLQFGRPGGHLRAGTPKQIPPEELAYGGRIWNWLTNGQSNLRGVGREPLPRGLHQPSSVPQIEKLRHRPLLAHMPSVSPLSHPAQTDPGQMSSACPSHHPPPGGQAEEASFLCCRTCPNSQVWANDPNRASIPPWLLGNSDGSRGDM